MKLRRDYAQERDNSDKQTPILVRCCNACGGEAFYMYLIEGHEHAQCCSCGHVECFGEHEPLAPDTEIIERPKSQVN